MFYSNEVEQGTPTKDVPDERRCAPPIQSWRADLLIEKEW